MIKAEWSAYTDVELVSLLLPEIGGSLARRERAVQLLCNSGGMAGLTTSIAATSGSPTLGSALELVREIFRSESPERITLDSPRKAACFALGSSVRATGEPDTPTAATETGVAFLDRRLGLISDLRFETRPDAGRSKRAARDADAEAAAVCRSVVTSNASYLILFDVSSETPPEPTVESLRLYFKLCDRVPPIGATVLDHLVVSRSGDLLSKRAAGVLTLNA